MTNILSNKENKNYFIYIFLFLISFSFVAIFSYSTTPFFTVTYTLDSTIFMSMGKMLYEGKIPYVDFFDHKGPIIIFINTLARIINPNIRTGVFIIQVLNLFLTIIFIFKTSRFFLNKAHSFILVIICLVYLVRSYSSGNFTEEYCLFFSFLSLFYSIKFVQTNYYLSNFSFFIFGLAAAFTFWTRINNSGVVIACILYIITILVLQKRWRKATKSMFYIFAGFLLLSIPILFYFWKIDALYDMIDASILSNLHYYNNPNILSEENKNTLHYFIFSFFDFKLPFFLLIVGIILYYKKFKTKKYILLSALILIITYICTQTSKDYIHYCILNLPVFFLGMLFIFSFIFLKKLNCKFYGIFITLSIIFSGILIIKSIKNNTHKAKTSQEITQEIIQITNKIPSEEYNSVFTYEIPPQIFLVTGISIYSKYYILQEWHIQQLNRPEIVDKVNKMMETNPPAWVIIKDFDNYANKKLINTLNNEYDLYYKTQNFKLYKKLTDYR